uniref:Uncharacterized protein n=1 Tax=Pyxicephalus adspersus TaxID=30357 RepID=A0AAV3A809_PYXAD|nr:TPA: hypothetical protein GDO54_011478 [Pyxicephalus adspersus]
MDKTLKGQIKNFIKMTEERAKEIRKAKKQAGEREKEVIKEMMRRMEEGEKEMRKMAKNREESLKKEIIDKMISLEERAREARENRREEHEMEIKKTKTIMQMRRRENERLIKIKKKMVKYKKKDENIKRKMQKKTKIAEDNERKADKEVMIVILKEAKSNPESCRMAMKLSSAIKRRDSFLANRKTRKLQRKMYKRAMPHVVQTLETIQEGRILQTQIPETTTTHSSLYPTINVKGIENPRPKIRKSSSKDILKENNKGPSRFWSFFRCFSRK